MPIIDGTDELQQLTQIEPIVMEYLVSIFRGAGAGLYDSSLGLAHTVKDAVLHPYDNLYVPIKDFFYSAVIVGAGMHGNNPMFMGGSYAILHQQLQANPRLYHAALKNLQEHAALFRDGIEAASGPQRTEIATRAAVGILAPGYFLKIARGFAANLEQFGTLRTPVRFPKYEGHPTRKGFFEQVSIQAIKLGRMTGPFIWIIDENNQLIISHYWMKQIEGGIQYYHSSLARVKPVIAAGELYTIEGKIVFINNNSGHYRPFGKHLKRVTETVFSLNGFPEASGKFQFGYNSRITQLPKDYVGPTPYRPSQGYGTPAVEGLVAGAAVQLTTDDASLPYGSILPSRAALGIMARSAAQMLCSSAHSASVPEEPKQLDETQSYRALLPSRMAAGFVPRPPNPLPDISVASSFSQLPDATASVTRPLAESLMPTPSMSGGHFDRREFIRHVFQPNRMQTLSTSLGSRPSSELEQTLQTRVHSALDTQSSAYIPSVPTAAESLMQGPSMGREHFARRSGAAQMFQPSPMERLATGLSHGPSIGLSQTLQARMQSAAVSPPVPTWASTLGYIPRPNPLQDVVKLHSSSQTDLVRTLQDRLLKKI